MATTSGRYHLGQFPPQELDWPRLIPLLGKAYALYCVQRRGGRAGIFVFQGLMNIAEGKDTF